LKDFRALRTWSVRAGYLDALEAVDGTIREELPDVWITRALERGDVEGAVTCWFEEEGHRRLRHCADQLVRACGDDHVELIISCRMSQITYRIGRKSRRHYRRACAVLRRLRDELEAAGAADYWRFVIEDITTQYGNRPALLDEMKKAGFIDD
ncbi:MAG: hypothetical protein ACOCV2_04700, partial [Persicimonas sp.]